MAVYKVLMSDAPEKLGLVNKTYLASEIAKVSTGTFDPSKVQAPIVFKGPATTSTTFNPGDEFVWNGRRLLATQTFTTGPSYPLWISGANYTEITGGATFYASDYGFRCDGNIASAASNTDALRRVIDDAARTDGATVQLPAGMGFLAKRTDRDCAVDIPSNVTLRGMGIHVTWLSLANAQNCVFFKFHTSTGAGDPNAFYAGLHDLTIDGNKGSQSAGPWHGVAMITLPKYQAQDGDPGFDPHLRLSNVMVRKCKGDGFYQDGRSGNTFTECFAQYNDGNGFTGSFDTIMQACQAEGNGIAGFTGTDNLIGCKAFLNGEIDPANGHGFYVFRSASLTGCQSQNNAGHGVLVDHSGCVIQVKADTNNNNNIGGTQGGGHFVGVALTANASNCLIDVVSTSGEQDGTGFIGAQLSAVDIASGAVNNSIRIAHSVGGMFANQAGPAVTATSSLAQNHVIANGAVVS